MKKSRFTESQIVALLKEADAGIPVGEVIRKHGISSASSLVVDGAGRSPASRAFWPRAVWVCSLAQVFSVRRTLSRITSGDSHRCHVLLGHAVGYAAQRAGRF